MLVEMGTLDNPTTTEPPLDVIIGTSGAGGGDKTSGIKAEAVPYVPSQRQFPTTALTINKRFINFNNTKLGCYNLEGKLMHYNVIALEEDADEYSKTRIDYAPSPALTDAIPMRPLMIQDIDGLKVSELKEEPKKKGQSTMGKKAPLVERLSLLKGWLSVISAFPSRHA